MTAFDFWVIFGFISFFVAAAFWLINKEWRDFKKKKMKLERKIRHYNELIEGIEDEEK